jgi:integrase
MRGLIDSYMKTVKGSPRYLKTQALYAGHIYRFLDRHPELPANPAEWNHRHLELYQDDRLEVGGGRTGRKPKKKGRPAPRPGTVARELRLWGRIFRDAMNDGLIDRNPLDRVRVIPDTKPEVTYRTIDEAHQLLKNEKLTPAERKLVLANRYLLPEDIEELLRLLRENAFSEFVETPGDVAMMNTLFGYTGMRYGEVARLDRTDIDLDIGAITARSRKQSKEVYEVQRHIPIDPLLLPHLKMWLDKNPARLLFGKDADTLNFRTRLYNRMDHVTAGTRFQRVRPHMFRHSMRSNLTMAGADERDIDDMIGHTTAETARRYRHIAIAKKKSSMEALARFRSATSTPTSEAGAGGTTPPPLKRHG